MGSKKDNVECLVCDTPHSVRDRRFLGLLMFFFIISLFVTFAAWLITKNVVERETQRLFLLQTLEIENRINDRINTYNVILDGLKAFWRGSNQINRDEFATYVKSLKELNRYPEISSIIYVERVNMDNLGLFVDRLNADFKTHQPAIPTISIDSYPVQTEYYLVKYIEPITGREKGLGQNMTREKKRKKAFEEARDTGEYATTGKITLSTTDSAGLMLISAIYKSGSNPTTVDQRRSNLLGFNVIVFREEIPISEFLGTEKNYQGVDFEIYEGRETTKAGLIYDYDPKFDLLSTPLPPSNRTIITVGKTPFTLIAGSKSGSAPISIITIPKIVLITGIALSFLMLCLFLYQFRRHLKPHHL